MKHETSEIATYFQKWSIIPFTAAVIQLWLFSHIAASHSSFHSSIDDDPSIHPSIRPSIHPSIYLSIMDFPFAVGVDFSNLELLKKTCRIFAARGSSSTKQSEPTRRVMKSTARRTDVSGV